MAKRKKIDKEQQLKAASKYKAFERLEETGLGQNKLVEPLETPETGRKQILKGHQEWYLGQAVLMDAYRKLEEQLKETTDPKEKATFQETQNRLALAMLQSYSKAAGLQTRGVDKLSSNPTTKKEHRGIQTTPVFDGERYHRSAENNPLVDLLREKTAKDLGVNQNLIKIANDPSIKEVVRRNFPLMTKEGERAPTELSSEEELTNNLILLKNAILKGQTIDNIFTLDLSALYKKIMDTEGNCQKAMDELTNKVEKMLMQSIEGLTKAQQEAVIKSLHNRLQPVVFHEHKGMEVVMALPLFKGTTNEFMETEYHKFMAEGGHDGAKLESAMMESGTRVDPIAAKEALLKLSSPLDLLKEIGIQPTTLATVGKVDVTDLKNKQTSIDSSIPGVVPSLSVLMEQPVWSKFKDLAKDMPEPVPPYIKIYTAATFDLLNGLENLLKDKGGIDQAFEDRGIKEVLQIAYYRLINAAQSAIFHKDDMLAFLNDIELMHDQMQMVLAITQPYEQDVDLEESIQRSLATTIPEKYKPIVRHKASAMHSLSSVFSSIEQLKGPENPVQVLTLKDNYYESSGAKGFDGAVQHAKAFKSTTLDGQKLEKEGSMTTAVYEDEQAPEPGSLDLYVCDFHHNISVQSNEYHVEDLIKQIDELYAQNIPSDTFTVAVDCTVDFIASTDNQALVAHFQEKIDAGTLNIVLFRSAQKFDMLGMDNYYGGFTVTINNGDEGPFEAFNQRMKRDDDQVGGLAHQGMAHTMEHGAEHTDAYRKALMDNTQYLYKELVSAGMGNKNSPIYIAKTTDPNAVFLDIQFPDAAQSQYPGSFYYALLNWGQRNNLALTTRQSFGFATSNLTMVPPKLRLNPGLEDKKSMNEYVRFFKESAEVLRKTKTRILAEKPGLEGAEKDRTLETHFKLAMNDYWQ